MWSRIPLRIGVPIILMGLPFALLPMALLGPGGVTIIWFGLIAHAVGADWLLVARQPRGVRGWRRAAAILAIGAPTALFSGWTMWDIIQQGDVAWMASPFAALPALLVWPVVIWALIGGDETPSAARPPQT